MKEAFLRLVEEGNIESVKELMTEYADLHTFHYILSRKESEKKWLSREAKVPGLNYFQLMSYIKYINDEQAKSTHQWANVAYKSWQYIDELDSKTINTALLIACKQGNAPMVKLLLKGGFNVSPVTFVKCTLKELKYDPYFKAYLKNPGYDIEFRQANPDSRYEEKTALALAIENDSQACVEKLLLAGAPFTNDTFDYCQSLIPNLLMNCTKAERKQLAKHWTVVFPNLFMATPVWQWPWLASKSAFSLALNIALPIRQTLTSLFIDKPRKLQVAPSLLPQPNTPPSPVVVYAQENQVKPIAIPCASSTPLAPLTALRPC